MAGPARAPRPVFLIGFMGAGKTSVGRLLAERLRRPFIDLDGLVEEREGAPIEEIFARHGEERFRAAEAEALASAARSEAVIAVGGGAPAHGSNLALMRAAGPVVLLKAAPQELLARLLRPGAHRGRPLLGDAEIGRDRLAERIADLQARRTAAYAQADLQVDTTGQSVHQVAAQVLAALAGAGP